MPHTQFSRRISSRRDLLQAGKVTKALWGHWIRYQKCPHSRILAEASFPSRESRIRNVETYCSPVEPEPPRRFSEPPARSDATDALRTGSRRLVLRSYPACSVSPSLTASARRSRLRSSSSGETALPPSALQACSERDNNGVDSKRCSDRSIPSQR